MRSLRRLMFVFLGLWIGLVVPVSAQSFSVGVFGSGVTDPNAASPLASPVTYSGASVACGQISEPETAPPIINPQEGRVADPTNSQRDCVFNLTAQLTPLAPRVGVRAAIKLVGVTTAYGPLSTAFELQTPHPCDTIPPATGTVVEGARTILWCWNGLDTNGNATTPSSWAVYVDNVRAGLTSVTAGSTANAAGLRQYSAPLTITRGTHAYQIVGVNTVGENQKSTAFTATVTAAPATMSPAVNVVIQ